VPVQVRVLACSSLPRIRRFSRQRRGGRLNNSGWRLPAACRHDSDIHIVRPAREEKKATPGLLHIGRQLQDHTGGRMMRALLEDARKAHAKSGTILDQKVIETQRYRMDILSDREGGFVHLVEFCGVATDDAWSCLGSGVRASGIGPRQTPARPLQVASGEPLRQGRRRSGLAQNSVATLSAMACPSLMLVSAEKWMPSTPSVATWSPAARNSTLVKSASAL